MRPRPCERPDRSAGRPLGRVGTATAGTASTTSVPVSQVSEKSVCQGAISSFPRASIGAKKCPGRRRNGAGACRLHRSRPVETTPTCVYRYYDRFDVLLYVGVTSRGTARNFEHHQHAEFWPYVARQEVEHLEDRGQALAFERSQIREHRPPFNKQHNLDCASMKEAYLAFIEAQGDSSGPFMDVYRRLGKRLPLILKNTSDETGVTAWLTQLGDGVVARTVEMPPNDVRVVAEDGTVVGRVCNVENRAIYSLVTARVRKGAAIETAVATLRTITLKHPIRTRICAVLLGNQE